MIERFWLWRKEEEGGRRGNHYQKEEFYNCFDHGVELWGCIELGLESLEMAELTRKTVEDHKRDREILIMKAIAMI